MNEFEKAFNVDNSRERAEKINENNQPEQENSEEFEFSGDGFSNNGGFSNNEGFSNNQEFSSNMNLDDGDEFINRFSNGQGEESSQGVENNMSESKARGGLLTGIIGALIATKLFSMIDKNGKISGMLGMKFPNQGQQGGQGQQTQAPPNQMQGQTGGSGMKGTASLLSSVLSIVGILIGIGIILFFVFYVLSFFMHDNLQPSTSIGAESSSDLSPWVDRLTGKRNNNLVIMSNRNYKNLLPYRYDDKTNKVYIYFPDNMIALEYSKKEWEEKYSINSLKDNGYVLITAIKNPEGVLTSIEPLALYDTDIKEEEGNKPEIDDPKYEGLGLTKFEYQTIKNNLAKGVKSTWFVRGKSNTSNEENTTQIDIPALGETKSVNQDGVVKDLSEQQEQKLKEEEGERKRKEGLDNLFKNAKDNAIKKKQEELQQKQEQLEKENELKELQGQIDDINDEIKSDKPKIKEPTPPPVEEPVEQDPLKPKNVVK